MMIIRGVRLGNFTLRLEDGIYTEMIKTASVPYVRDCCGDLTIEDPVCRLLLDYGKSNGYAGLSLSDYLESMYSTP